MSLKNAACIVALAWAGTSMAATDFSQDACPPDVTQFKCFELTLLRTTYACELNAISTTLRLERGLPTEGIESILRCASAATTKLAEHAKPVQAEFSANKDVAAAIKELRIAHKLYLEGLVPTASERRVAYDARTAQLKQNLEAKKAALELELE